MEEIVILQIIIAVVCIAAYLIIRKYVDEEDFESFTSLDFTEQHNETKRKKV